MKKYLKYFCILFLLASCGPKGIDRFGWLEGEWRTSISDIDYSEYWKKTSTELMNGTSYLVQQGDTVHRDQLKIEIIGETPCFILNMPGNNEPVIFKMTGSTAQGATFENGEHDFPKLVGYELMGDSLHVKFEGVRDGHNAREEIYYRKKKAAK